MLVTLDIGGPAFVSEERAVITVATKEVVQTERTIANLETSVSIAEKAEATATTVSTPKVKAQVNSRHYMDSKSISKGRTAPSTVAPRDIIDADVKAYNSGNYKKTKNGDVLINNRQYGLENEGKTLFPRSGGAPEFTDLTQGQIKAIQIIKTSPIDKIAKALTKAKISAKDIKFASEFVQKH